MAWQQIVYELGQWTHTQTTELPKILIKRTRQNEKSKAQKWRLSFRFVSLWFIFDQFRANLITFKFVLFFMLDIRPFFHEHVRDVEDV